MAKSRREFLGTASAGFIAALTVPEALKGAPAMRRDFGGSAMQQPTEAPAGAPPAYGAGPAFGPEVSTATFSEAEKLVQISLNSEERTEAAESWRVTMAALYERRVGPRKVPIEASVAPYSQWNPVLPGQEAGLRSTSLSAARAMRGRCRRAMKRSLTRRLRNCRDGSNRGN